MNTPCDTCANGHMEYGHGVSYWDDDPIREGDTVVVDWDWTGTVVSILPDGFLSIAVSAGRGGGMARVKSDRCEVRRTQKPV